VIRQDGVGLGAALARFFRHRSASPIATQWTTLTAGGNADRRNPN